MATTLSLEPLKLVFRDRAGGSRPVRPGTFSWWRRGDSTFRGFRCGLDYAFIRNTQLSERRACGACYPDDCIEPDPSARPGPAAFGESMSLYRAGLKLAFFLPLGVAMPPAFPHGAVRFHRCELRFQSLLTK